MRPFGSFCIVSHHTAVPWRDWLHHIAGSRAQRGAPALMKKRGWQGFIVTQPGRRRRDGRESVSWRVCHQMCVRRVCARLCPCQGLRRERTPGAAPSWRDSILSYHLIITRYKRRLYGVSPTQSIQRQVLKQLDEASSDQIRGGRHLVKLGDDSRGHGEHRDDCSPEAPVPVPLLQLHGRLV